jgi:hypothetical protein
MRTLISFSKAPTSESADSAPIKWSKKANVVSTHDVLDDTSSVMTGDMSDSASIRAYKRQQGGMATPLQLTVDDLNGDSISEAMHEIDADQDITNSNEVAV